MVPVPGGVYNTTVVTRTTGPGTCYPGTAYPGVPPSYPAGCVAPTGAYVPTTFPAPAVPLPSTGYPAGYPAPQPYPPAPPGKNMICKDVSDK